MKIYDVIPLTPPGVQPEEWAKILAEVHGPGHEYPATSDDRMGWLKRLAEEEVWGEAIVITDHTAFPFWRLVPDKVIVQNEAGKKLGKPQRTQLLYNWATGVHINSIKQSEITRWEKSYKKAGLETAEALDPIVQDYQLGKSNARSLYETDGTYELITPGGFSEIREKILQHIDLGNVWAWDSETDQTNEEDSESPNPWSAKLVDLSFAITPGHAWRMPIAHDGAENFHLQTALNFLDECYQHTTAAKTFALLHNCKYDYSVLANPIQGFDPSIIYNNWLPVTVDTMLAAQCANMRPAGLKPLARRELGVTTIDFKKLTGGKPFSQVPEEPANIYAGQDADWLLRLWPIISARMDELQVREVYERRLRVTEFFMRIERRGMKPNVEKLQALHDRSVSERQRCLEGLVGSLIDAGVRLGNDFNPGSSVQLARAFFAPLPDGLGLPVLTRTKTGAPSAGAKARNALAIAGVSHPSLSWLKRWSEHEQRITAFTTPMLTKFIQSDGRIHPSFGVAATETGRTSCQKPNVQQFDEELASCFDTEGEFADLDYSQVELRVLAVVFNEPKMLETYNKPRYLTDETGKVMYHPVGHKDAGLPIENPAGDIHDRTQRELNIDSRRTAKGFNFGKAFGAGDETLSITTNRPLSVVRPLSQAYDRAYPDRTKNIKAAIRQAEEDGLVRAWDGWVRLLPPPTTDKQKAANGRLVSNTPVQAGATGIIMLAIDRALPLVRMAEKYDIHPFNMVHDALYFERGPQTPTSAWASFLRAVMLIMEQANPWPDKLPIYADVKVGKNWGDDLHVPTFIDVDDTEATMSEEVVLA